MSLSRSRVGVGGDHEVRCRGRRASRYSGGVRYLGRPVVATRMRGEEVTRIRGEEATRIRAEEATRIRGEETTRTRGAEATLLRGAASSDYSELEQANSRPVACAGPSGAAHAVSCMSMGGLSGAPADSAASTQAEGGGRTAEQVFASPARQSGIDPSQRFNTTQTASISTASRVPYLQHALRLVSPSGGQSVGSTTR